MFLTLYDRDGATVLATDDDSGSGHNAAIAYTLTQSGTYYAEARHFNGTQGTCDEYLLGGILEEPALPDAFEPDNTASQAKPLPLDGSMQQRSFHVSDDDDWVSFPARRGDRIFIATEGTCDTFISVFAPDRRTIVREDDDSGGNLNAALLFTATEAGTFYARVRAFGGSLRACPSYQLYGALVSSGGGATPVGTPGAAPTGTPATAVPAGSPTRGVGPSVPGATPTTVPLFPVLPESTRTRP
jgi:hypothetical protein